MSDTCVNLPAIPDGLQVLNVVHLPRRDDYNAPPVTGERRMVLHPSQDSAAE